MLEIFFNVIFNISFVHTQYLNKVTQLEFELN